MSCPPKFPNFSPWGLLQVNPAIVTLSPYIPPVADYIVTEGGSFITTESGIDLTTEN